MVAVLSKPFVAVPSSTTTRTPRETHAEIARLYTRVRASLVRDAARILPRSRDEARDAVQDALVAVLAAGIASEEALRAATRRAAMVRARSGRLREATKYEIARGARALDLFEREPTDEGFDDA